MKNAKMETAVIINAKQFAKFVDLKVDAKALKKVKGGEDIIIVDDNIIG